MSLRAQHILGPMATYGRRRRYHQSPPPPPPRPYELEPEAMAFMTRHRRHMPQPHPRSRFFAEQREARVGAEGVRSFSGLVIRDESDDDETNALDRAMIDDRTHPRRRSPHTLPHYGVEEHVTQPLLWLGLEALDMHKKLIEAQIMALASTSSVPCSAGGACGPLGACEVIEAVDGIGANTGSGATTSVSDNEDNEAEAASAASAATLPDPETDDEVKPSQFVAEFLERNMTLQIFRDGNAPRYGPSNPSASPGRALARPRNA
ncbi:uncharacterized protein Dana_GF21958, isoform A [Drosophila ananassae]|uniref:Uncharacterized protein, isoform A n=1 Tax=Drosophila ananassae TaxID=7217 RepID=B3MYU9_DROAN|nr:uncharacterized protein LOC6504628 isoform X1 [Drosophila ananassae]EDV32793.1 uncharacterized protein Dana_GF21958, isoform A [Drosophila ananassae]